MTDKSPDKTRIQKPGNARGENGSRPSGADDRTGDGENKSPRTRIAPAASSADSAKREDSTRLAPKKKSAAATDATRFQPSARQGAAKTRFAPAKKSRDDTIPNLQPGAASAAEQPDLHVLKERFVLEEVLGTGGMGIVYKAKDLLMEEAQDRDPYVAIKVLSEEFKTHPEAFISLQRESRKSQRIAHPNIVNVYDFDRDGDTVFMTMEFLDGEPLDELINRYRSTGLPTDEVWEIIDAMASALDHAHAERIIHSDFKPGNVFVTRKGLTKVFDFGIARAVAQVEHLDDMQADQTLFDAGNLGALTPAYASLEMLEGEEPDVRDDIFALGCVAYEMLTGEHPYHKVPADEAERQGLKPRRITNIKKSQWRAIEKAIAFRRENRMATVKEFRAELLPEHKPLNWLMLGLAASLAVVVGGYLLFFQPESDEAVFSEFDIRNELELKIKIDFYREDIDSLLQDPSFSKPWQDSMWKNISDLRKLTKGEDPWVDQKSQQVYGLYLQQIQTETERKNYTRAESLIENATRYATDETRLDEIRNRIIAARQKQRELQNQQDRKKQEQKQKELALTKQRQAEQEAAQAEAAKKQDEVRQRKEQFEVALDNVNNQLKCQASLNMGNFETAIGKLKQLDQARYRALEQDIINALATCIVQVGKAFPERAEAAKKHGMRIFSSSTLAQITIKSRDPCDQSLAGLGARGKRAICKDRLKDKSSGPDMVVIPASGKIPLFAIGKYEVSVAEMNYFCKATNSCKTVEEDGQLPVSNIPLSQASSYLKWLSRETNKTYRLPEKSEWMHAARSRSKSLDPNRNCKLSTRGITKGDELIKNSIGKQNGWGLVNYVGNVQEWVYHSGRRLEAVGGSFRQPMESCTITTSNSHNGEADDLTGFRVLREIGG